jgi:hypothetical protein
MMRDLYDHDEEDDTDPVDDDAYHSHWVDDRNHPIYPRGDIDWSLHHAQRVDHFIITTPSTMFTSAS